MKAISILGSTGSIGRQTLDIVREHPDDFRVLALAAGKNNLSELAKQIQTFRPEFVSVADAASADELVAILKTSQPKLIPKIAFGSEGLDQTASYDQVDLVVSAVVGFKGVSPTLSAIKAGKNIALANKETLVAAGYVIMAEAKKKDIQIIPVDSEHSAIHQSLGQYSNKQIKQILLTGSGGPFRTWSAEQIQTATVDDALKHPNWSMGPKITIDSATLMNKGLEIIEARWLFDVSADQIKVLIHPQSVLHSAVEFIDNSVVGQMGLPDMHLPIHYSLYYPQRSKSEVVPPLDFVKLKMLTFEEPDLQRFPCLAIAKEVAKYDDTRPAVLNAANEIVVEAVLNKSVKFCEIPKCIEHVLQRHKSVSKPSLADILEADRWARQVAGELVGALAK